MKLPTPIDCITFNITPPGESKPSEWNISMNLINDKETFLYVIEIFIGMGLNQDKLWSIYPGGHQDVEIMRHKI